LRTYLYKLTSDRGGAPCATPPAPGEDPLLTLAICKPAIRRTAQSGDRLLGITSHSLAHSDGYPLNSVIYAAIVHDGLDARDYFVPTYTHRPDCIYEFHRLNGTATHTGRSGLHAAPEHLLKDLGRYPFYKNGRILLSHDFRYFGSGAVKIPARLRLLNHAAEALGQGHRVYTGQSPEHSELNALFRLLWKRPTAPPVRSSPTPTITPHAAAPNKVGALDKHRLQTPAITPKVRIGPACIAANRFQSPDLKSLL
jgi:hypothetical protein